MCAQVGKRGQRGFTLFELMVVIVIIGVLASLAMPTMLEGRRDQRAFEDAASISELLRNARTRAIGRGTATLVTFDRSNGSRGKFTLSEATGPSSMPNIQPGILKAPRGSCASLDPNAWVPNTPDSNGNVIWTLPNQFIDAVDLDGSAEIDANIWSRVFVHGTPDNQGGPTCNSAEPQRLDVCFTPSGRPFVALDTNPPIFTPANAFSGVVEVQVARLLPAKSVVTTADAAGPIRHVLLPPSGISRINSTLN